MVRDTVTVLRSAPVETPDGGIKNGPAVAIQTIRTNVKFIQPSRKLEALQTAMKTAIEFEFWQIKDFELQSDDALEYQGKRYTPIGPAVPTGSTRRTFRVIALEQ